MESKKVHSRVHKSSQLVPVLSQMNNSMIWSFRSVVDNVFSSSINFFLCNPDVHHQHHKILSLVPAFSQFSPLTRPLFQDYPAV